MTKTALLLSLLLVAYCTSASVVATDHVARQHGYCSMYGSCDTYVPPRGGLPYPAIDCANTTEARWPTFAMPECPMLTDRPVCCDYQQYTEFVDGFNYLVPFLSVCRACVESFRAYLCSITCGPDQGLYTVVNGTKPATYTNKSVVTSAELYVSSALLHSFYDSCANVRVRSTGQTVFEFALSAYNFEDFLDKVLNAPESPVHYYFHIDESPGQQLDNDTIVAPIIACNDQRSKYSCICYDCPAKCDRCENTGTHTSNDTDIINAHHLAMLGSSYLEPTRFAAVFGFLVVLTTMLGAWSVRRYSQARLHSGTAFAIVLLSLQSLALLLLFLIFLAFLLYVVSVDPVSDVSVGDETGLVYALSSYIDPVFGIFVLTSAVGIIAALVAFTLFYTPPQVVDYEPDTVSDTGHTHRRRRNDTRWTKRLLASHCHFVAHRPWVVILLGVIVTGLCSFGWLAVSLESDPLSLWVSPSSTVMKEKQLFDQTFGPFFRTEQLIITVANNVSDSDSGSQSVFAMDKLMLIQQWSDIIQSFNVTISDNDSDNGTITVNYQSFCYRPIPGSGCIIESPLQYFVRTSDWYALNDPDDVPPVTAPPLNASVTNQSTVMDWIAYCANNYISDPCRGSIGAPLYPWVIFGGYSGSDYANSTALIITLLLDNSPANQSLAMQWESELIAHLNQFVINATVNGLSLSYLTERSIEDEITRGTFKDIDIIVLSYIIMFVYIALSLSASALSFPLSQWPVHSRVMLALSAIAIVLASLSSSVGIVSVIGVKMTPIISEVIPFLVLAIGIDNIFILHNTFQSQPLTLSHSERLYRTMNEVGTSVTLAALSESMAFLLGAATDMPAVIAFAVYSSVAILIDYLLQVTVFCAIMVLDARRMESGRWDVLVCVRDAVVEAEIQAWKIQHQSLSQSNDSDSDNETKEEKKVQFKPSLYVRETLQPSRSSINAPPSPSPFHSESRVRRLLRHYYFPFLFHNLTRLLVLLTFTALFFALTGYGLTSSQLGLDQKSVLPLDSELQQYFSDQERYLNVGPPVYFVIKHHNHSGAESESGSDREPSYDYSDYHFQNLICSLNDCYDTNLEGLIDEAACTLNSSIASSPSSWLDTYMQWVSSASCCNKLDSDGSYITYDDCENVMFGSGCGPCLPAMDDLIAPERPQPGNFTRYLDSWLHNSTCSASCGFCSAGLYDSITFTTAPYNDSNGDSVSIDVQSSRYMSYHRPLRSQSDYISAIANVRELTQRIVNVTGLDVFPYSIIYVYFQQYLDIAHVAIINVCVGFAIIFVLSLLMVQDVWLSLIIIVTIVMILGDLVGCMALWSISINALSVLNLIMAIGISVEFCIHFTVKFQLTRCSSTIDRVCHAYYTIGTSIISGIALTKVSGIVVLSFASSAVFQIYYFRMYLLIVLLGVAHGLVWLPVLLSIIGTDRPRVEGKHRRWRDWFGCLTLLQHTDWDTDSDSGSGSDSEDEFEPGSFSGSGHDRSAPLLLHSESEVKDQIIRPPPSRPLYAVD